VNRTPAPCRSMHEISGPFFPLTLRKPHHRALERRPGVLERPAGVEVSRVVPDHRIDERHGHFEGGLMPALAVATVGTWGFTVWIYQSINGPPGPPSK